MSDSSHILLVDNAVNFGGSLNVGACIVSRISGGQFQSHMLAYVEPKLITANIDHASITTLPKPFFNYARKSLIRKRIQQLPGKFLQKSLNYCFEFFFRAFSLLNIARVCAIVIRKDISLLHVNNGIDAAIAAIILDKPFVYHLHGCISTAGRLDINIIKKAKKIIAISEFIRDDAVKAGFEQDQLMTIPNPFTEFSDTDTSDQLKQKYQISDSDFVIGHFGRLVKWKGQHLLIEAISRMTRKENLKVLIIGDASDGPQEFPHYLHELVEKYELQDIVIFTGFTSDVKSHYSLIDVLVHSSIESEPFGLVIVEALSNGVPAIVSDLGAGSEIIQEDYDGYVVSPFDSEQMAAKIERLMQNPDTLKTLSGNALESSKKYLPENYAASISALYDQILQP